MQDIDMEILYNKAGGAFRATVLIQKRIKQLQKKIKEKSGTAKVDYRELMTQAKEEILNDKIELLPDFEVEEKEGINIYEMFNVKKNESTNKEDIFGK